MPGVNGPVGKNYSGGADVIAAVILIGQGHGLCQLLGADIVEVCTLFHIIPVDEKTQLNDGQCDVEIEGGAEMKKKTQTNNIRVGREASFHVLTQEGSH